MKCQQKLQKEPGMCRQWPFLIFYPVSENNNSTWRFVCFVLFLLLVGTDKLGPVDHFIWNTCFICKYNRLVPIFSLKRFSLFLFSKAFFPSEHLAISVSRQSFTCERKYRSSLLIFTCMLRSYARNYSLTV